MNLMKLVMAALAAFIVMMLLDGLIHMKLMGDFYHSHMISPCIIERAQPMGIYIIVAELILAFIMAYMYPKGVESDNKLMEGFKFGALIGILYVLPLNLIQYGLSMMLSRTLILSDTIIAIIVQGIGGIIIAYVYGNSVMPKPKQG